MPQLRNARHETFAQAVAAGKTNSEAHKEAGCSGDRRTAHHMRRRGDVERRIAELLVEKDRIYGETTAEAAKAAGLSRRYVIEGLMENYRRAMQAEPVLDNQGNPTGEYRYEAAAANKALELLGRALAMFTLDERPTTDTAALLALLSSRGNGGNGRSRQQYDA